MNRSRSPLRRALAGLARALPLAAALAAAAPPAPAQCAQQDDGVSDTALGLAAGGEFGWMHVYPCTEGVAVSVQWVEVAYGSPASPGAFAGGGASRIALYEDLDDDGDPGGGFALLAVRHNVVVNPGTDVFVAIPFLPFGHGFGDAVGVLVTADQAAGELPAPLDTSSPGPDAWIVGDDGGPGSLDLADLAANSLPPTRVADYATPGLFLLRPFFADLLIFNPTCFGNGGGAPCGCGNETSPEEGGCANSTGHGTMGFATGTPALSNDTFRLWAHGAPPGQPGLFFQGNAQLGGGGGLTFGDGLRCCGQSVVRIAVVAADAAGCASSHGACGTPLSPSPGPISQLPGNAGLQPGDQRCYQYWYRDPAGPCASGFNLTNALVTFWF